MDKNSGIPAWVIVLFALLSLPILACGGCVLLVAGTTRQVRAVREQRLEDIRTGKIAPKDLTGTATDEQVAAMHRGIKEVMAQGIVYRVETRGDQGIVSVHRAAWEPLPRDQKVMICQCVFQWQHRLIKSDPMPDTFLVIKDAATGQTIQSYNPTAYGLR